MKNFFQEFKQHREEQEITLEDISDVTKINVRFLQALEEGNFEVLPETYIRLFLRAYAKEIGIDPDEAIEKLEIYQGKVADFQPRIREPQPELPEKPEFGESPGSPRINLKPNNTFNWKRTLLIIILFVAVIWAIKSYVSSSQERSPNTQSTELQSARQGNRTVSSEDVVSDEQFEGGEVVDRTQQSVPSVNASEDIVLQVNAVARTWLRVRRDNAPTEEYLFLPQDSKTLRATNRIELRIGNSAGANLTLNGEPIPDLGSSNTVSDLVINENGVVDKTTVIPMASSVVGDTTAS